MTTTPSTTPKLRYTKDYSLFDTHAYNRPLHEDKGLLESLRKYGFMPSSPIQCITNGSGKLTIVRGHHRFVYAQRLGLGVWYVVDDSCTELFPLEASRLAYWSPTDHVHARVLAGSEDYAFLADFMKKHHLPIVVAASLVGGESASSGNKLRNIKQGTFKVGDLAHAKAVVEITDECYRLGLQFGTTGVFVRAISAMLRVPEFDAKVFLNRLRLYPANLHRRTSVDEYLEEIEALYYYTAKGRRHPLAFQAKAIGRERKRTFGRTSQN